MLKLLGCIILGIIIKVLVTKTTWTYDRCDSYGVFIVVFSCVLLIFFIITIVDVFAQYIEHIKDIEKITEKEQDKKVYKKKRDDLAEIFKQYLAVEYPQYEKEIFSKLLPENITAVATIFPEIKASKTISSYCDRIGTLAHNIYDQDLKINELKRKIRVRLRDKTGWWFLLPKE